MSMKRASFTQYRYLAKFYTKKEYSTYDHQRTFRAVRYDGGKPWEKIVIFTIPMLIGNIAQQLYNTVDSIVIGKYVGDNALAAVGSASPILNLLLVLFVGSP